MNFGERLRELVEESGQSQAELARICDIGYRNFNHYVNGKRNPDFDSVVKICIGLKVSPNVLFKGNWPIEGLSPDEATILNAYRQAGEDQRRMLLASAEAALPFPRNRSARP